MDRMISCDKGNYYIENELVISDTSFFIARCEKSAQPFMVGERQSSAYMTNYEDLAVTEDYVSALEELTRRITNAIKKMKLQQSTVRT